MFHSLFLAGEVDDEIVVFCSDGSDKIEVCAVRLSWCTRLGLNTRVHYQDLGTVELVGGWANKEEQVFKSQEKWS